MGSKRLFLSHRVFWRGAIAGILLVTNLPITRAQIAGDGTLGTQVNGSLTAPCTGACLITNGTTRGVNLFHSFQQFSLPNRDLAAFITNPNIQNVIVRVTSIGQPFISNINGTIATTDPTVRNVIPTNFFLLNPNGIVFGPNARLFNGGSFLATTAERMLFQDGTILNTRDPSPAPLLTISVPIGLQMGRSSGAIQSRMQIYTGINSLLTDFALVGGDVMLDNSVIQTLGRRVELAGVGENGVLGVQINGNDLSLSIPENISRTDISIKGSLLRVDGINNGSIALNARNIDILGGSFLVAGIGEGQGITGSQAENITLNSFEKIQLRGASKIVNYVFPEAIGNSGEIQITTSSLSIAERSQLSTSTFAQGNAGNISIQAHDQVTLDAGVVSSNVEFGAVGQGGNIAILTGTLVATNGGALLAVTAGQGDAGNIAIQSYESVSFNGVGSNASPSGVFNGVEFNGVGKGGNLTIKTKTLSLTGGAQFSVGTRGQGNGGSVLIHADDGIFLDAAGIFSNVEPGAVGNGGSIKVESESLSLTNGAQLVANTRGRGDAGNILIQGREKVSFYGATPNGDSSGVFSAVEPGAVGQGGNIRIEAESFSLSNSAELLASTYGQGNAGNISIQVRDGISFDGVGSNGFPSGTFSTVDFRAVGKGGNITIAADFLSVTNGAQVLVFTNGRGDAGNILVQTRDRVVFDGTGGDQISSAAVSTVERSAVGHGGNIAIETKSLFVANNALLVASTFGTGNAGNITVTAELSELTAGGQLRTSTSSARDAGNITLQLSDRLTLSGPNTGLFANTAPGSTGNGGNITIDPRFVLIQDGATIAVDSKGSGIGGSITLQAGRLELRNQGSITAETASAQGGNISLDIKDILLMRRNSLISATAGNNQAEGDGGNITIRSPFIIGVLGENSDITANAYRGNGGKITINTNAIYGLKFQPKLTPFSDITASSEFGLSGTVAINTLGIDPNRGLVALPANLTDLSQQIVQDCVPKIGKTASSFVVTGRGGIPFGPEEMVQTQPLLSQWVQLPEQMGSEGERVRESEGERVRVSEGERVRESEGVRGRAGESGGIVEAQGWIVHPNGQVELVAELPQPSANLNANPYTAAPSWLVPVVCGNTNAD